MAGEWRNATEVLTIVVRDMPQPQGSKKGFPVKRANGKMGVQIVSVNSEKLETWRDAVKKAARDAMEAQNWEVLQFPLTDVPVAISVTFTRPRPKVMPKGRTKPIVMPDLDKQKRAVGDALKAAGVYRDDAQITASQEWKRYTLLHTGYSANDRLETPGCVIRVWLDDEEEEES